MKSIKVFLIVVMIILSIFSTSIVVFGEDVIQAIVIDKILYIYENANTNSKVVTSLGIGDSIFVSGNEGKWLKISTKDGISGWIHSQSVLIIDNSKNPIKEGVVNNGYIGVHEFPDPNSELKGTLGFTSKVSIVAQEGTWLNIAIGDEILGWVPAQDITVMTTPIYPKAMVTSNKSQIKIEPIYNSDTVVEVEKSTILLLKDYESDYFHVALQDGKEGWIHKYEIKSARTIIDEKQKSYFNNYKNSQLDKNKLENDPFEDIKKVATLIGKDFSATAYDLSIASCGKAVGDKYRGFTSTGIDLNSKQWGDVMIAAVDPREIPLGSRILVIFKADDWRSKYNGVYVAGDTGGGVKGRTIDIYLGDNGNEELEVVKKFGREKDVEIYLID